MNPLIQSKNTTILPVLIALTLGCFGLSPQAQAVCEEGCLTNANTVLGEDALSNNTTGSSNTAIGLYALRYNTAGNFNTANGAYALSSNTTGHWNTATGLNTLYLNTTGSNNTANGHSALKFNTTGSNNTANGDEALYYNTTANNNTATGANALRNTTGGGNVANGGFALYHNTTGSFNTVDGAKALGNNTSGNSNIALGYLAGQNLTTGSYNIYIANAGGSGGESAKIRIGTRGTQTATFIAGISGTAVVGDTVVVDGNGQLGTVASAARFKKEIKPIDKTSESILALKPVTFRYKHEIDPAGIPQFGLVAEEVEKVNPDLVARDVEGKAYTVRYEAVNAILINEFLKGHREVHEQKATIARQQKQIEALTKGLQKVSAQLEASKPAPQIVRNNQ
jgi:hypothetical protein